MFCQYGKQLLLPKWQNNQRFLYIYDNAIICLRIFMLKWHYNRCFFKFGAEVGVEESIVNAPPNYNSDYLFKSDLTF
jgi:hypothetical protein